MQYHASYILENLWRKALNPVNDEVRERTEILLKKLSSFDLTTEDGYRSAGRVDDPVLAALSNTISRGTPTRPSVRVEETLASLIDGATRKDHDVYGIVFEYPEFTAEFLQMYRRSLCAVDPRLPFGESSAPRALLAQLGSDFEKNFLLERIPALLGTHIAQLLQPQRDFESIVQSNDFRDQRADFTLEFPWKIAGKQGLIIEIDGEQHTNAAQASLDKQRDATADRKGWKTIRIATSQWAALSAKLSFFNDHQDNSYFQMLRLNVDSPLYASSQSRLAMQLCLAPIAIARVQKAIAELLLRGALNLNEDCWRIAVIERDVPCGELALRDFSELLQHFFDLEGMGRKAPEMEIDVYTTPEFLNAQLHRCSEKNPRILDQTWDGGSAYNLILDVSMLQRAGMSDTLDHDYSTAYYTIRSVYTDERARTFHTHDVITYRDIAHATDTEKWDIEPEAEEILRYFLRNWFRKLEFRPGQLAILGRALKGKSVVGLLPTGGGKSLTYQMASLLQPGVTLVIDPIISLMKDQVDGLRRNWIDACSFVNSTLNTKERREALRRFTHGEVLFCFVSPERLQIQEFRATLQQMAEDKVFFSYFVIDEAHCVSEWGHDFRTSYLRLGSNARRHCKTRNLDSIPMFGLTATASFDVLSDVQRELNALSEHAVEANTITENSVVRHETVNRPELYFRILPLELDEIEYNDDWKAKEALGRAKKEALANDLRRLPREIAALQQQAHIDREVVIPDYTEGKFTAEDCLMAGIVFCPHRSWEFGVTDRYKSDASRKGILDFLQSQHSPALKLGWFMGSAGDGEAISRAVQQDSLNNQDRFLHDDFHLMVATKAFGMGIDKPNIRYTYHINYPQSLESFVQEAGRAGRDRKFSVCTILHNDQEFRLRNTTSKLCIDRDILTYFHSNSFRGVDKEMSILDELLEGIHRDGVTNARLVENLVQAEYELAIQANLWPKENPHLLYINQLDGENVGYIDLKNGGKYPDAAFGDAIMAVDILTFIADAVTSAASTAGTGLVTWLRKESESTVQPGIKEVLASLEPGQSTALVLEFTNDVKRREKALSDLLLKHSKKPIDGKVIARFSSLNWQQVVQKCAELGVAMKELSTAEQNALKECTISRRDKNDTEKAIYRLSILGIVRDYTVDYNSNSFTLTIARRSKEEIIESIRAYMRLYYSEVRTEEKMVELRSKMKKDALRDSLRFLIEFIYLEVAERRKVAIDTMNMACREGVLESGDMRFKEFLDLYFNSLYARREYLPEDTKDGIIEDVTIVWKYIDIVHEGSQITNLKHLRGACIRLLNMYQKKNPVFLLLKAFAQLVLEPENAALVEDSREALVEGFRAYVSGSAVDGMQYEHVVNEYRERIKRFTNDARVHTLLDQLVAELVLDYHIQWIQKFNMRMLQDV